ncbi:MAG: DUF3182 family protein [Candidatus Saccharimonadales bacterium]
MKDIIVSVPSYQPGNFEGMYLEQRNTAVAEHLAALLGGQVCGLQDSAREQYHVPHAALIREESQEKGITSENDLFGGVVEIASHRDKAILHPTVKDCERKNEWHSSEFAKLVSSAVLPGFSVFSSADSQKAFQELEDQGYTVRCKDPTRDGSGGQWIIKDSGHLEQIIAGLPADQISEQGIVLEPNLFDPQTLSVGQIYLDGKFYSYFGHQESTTSPKGNSTYGGTTLTMVRGTFETLATTSSEPIIRRAVQQAKTVYDAYSIYEPIISRANFDVVRGEAKNNQILSGVVDQSLRIGGATPAEVLAIEALKAQPSAQQVTSRVTIRWNPESTPVGPNEIIFFDHPRKRDLATVLEIK